MELTEEEVADIITYQIGALKGFCDLEGVPLNHVKVRKAEPRTKATPSRSKKELTKQRHPCNVQPHGALYFYIKNSRSHCVAAYKAIKPLGVPVCKCSRPRMSERSFLMANLAYPIIPRFLPDGLGGTLHEEVAKELDVPFVPELFVDIEYSKEGALIPPAQSKKITPQESAERARKVAETGCNFAQGGGDVKMPEFGHDENGGKCKPFSICIHSDLPGAEKTAAE